LALAEAGLPVRDELVATALNYHRRDGAEAMSRLLAADEPPDAVFCFNDLLAVGAVRAAAERGVRVPADVAVVGFDNVEEGAYSLPSLTTVAPDKAAIARAAVDLLLKRVEDPERPPEHLRTPFSLEVRESTRGER
ncbi:substrate-binding domain-containing protein, partial [Actinosynnema sp. NPDC023658]|uniref:LacI family DNA-binding transcriptional regulator n=1 Tax=Actinosynnema sp. NPDC023658 TaxID=3155465 RepID=UPI0033C60479